MKQCKTYLVALFLVLKSQFCVGQSSDQRNNEGSYHMHSIFSKILKEERSFTVYTPPGYETCTKSFGVLYRLDAEVFAPDETARELEPLVKSGRIPPMMVVSVYNTDRDRDMSPIETSFCENPGAQRFLDFISSELIPHVGSNFRTTSFRILCGQSYSCVFVLFALLESPFLFNGYIASSLYFPQCEDYFIGRSLNAFTEESFENRFLYITRGGQDYRFNNEGKTERALNRLCEIVNDAKPADFSLEYKVYDDYGHCPEPSLADGLSWMCKTAQN
jgi:predicted alpha/beta superfamily hydrolase